MKVSELVLNEVRSIPPGKIFGYSELQSYSESPTAVIKALSRLVSKNDVQRLSKGKFYTPEKGFLGPRKPKESEIIRSMLYKKGRLNGYVTGFAAYNQLGLTTQLPSTVTVACNGGLQLKDLGTIKVRIISTRAPIRKENIKLLQYLDALKDIKSYSEDIEQSFELLQNRIGNLSSTEAQKITDLAKAYYAPRVRASLGMLISKQSQNRGLAESLASTLNPVTTYKFGLGDSSLFTASEWRIQ